MESTGGDGHPRRVTQSAAAIAATCSSIVDLQKIRRFCIKSQSRCDRSIESLIASRIGFRIDMPEDERKAIFKRASDIRKRVEKEGGDQSSPDDQVVRVAPFLRVLILQSADARAGWDVQRETAEKEMERIVASLPIEAWQAGIKGFGKKGLAIVIGEACGPDAPTVADYRKVSGLWKRLGHAVINGARQQRRAGAEAAKEQGYSPQRRAEMWSLADSMFKHQWAGDKDEDGNDPKKSGKPVAVPAHAIGPYGEVYGRRKQHKLPMIEATEDLPSKIQVGGKEFLNPEKWTAKRCDNDARRIMFKALLRDLWVEWRRLASTQPRDG